MASRNRLLDAKTCDAGGKADSFCLNLKQFSASKFAVCDDLYPFTHIMGRLIVARSSLSGDLGYVILAMIPLW